MQVIIIVNRKRPCVQDWVMEVVNEMNKQSEEAEKRFYIYEEKRMKLEASLEEQRRKREEEHELCMQEIFMKMIQQVMPPTFNSPFSHPY